MLREEAAVIARPFPVAVGDLRDDLAALFDGFEDGSDVERLSEGGLHADLDIVEIDEDRDFQACVCQGVLRVAEARLRGAPASGRTVATCRLGGSVASRLVGGLVPEAPGCLSFLSTRIADGCRALVGQG
jgi:hypothetical protein